MGKRLVQENERITQKSIGFFRRQIDFLHANPEFKIDTYCRQIMDEQIKLNKQEKFL